MNLTINMCFNNFYMLIPKNSSANLFEQIMARGNELAFILSQYIPNSNIYTLSTIFKENRIDKDDAIDIDIFEIVYSFKSTIRHLCKNNNILSMSPDERKSTIEDVWNHHIPYEDNKVFTLKMNEQILETLIKLFDLVASKKNYIGSSPID